jgi:predicted acetyltransferase
MSELFLVKPSKKYADEIQAYRKEFIEHGSHRAGDTGLRNCEDIDAWIRQCRLFERAETVPIPGWVESEQFMLIRKDKCSTNEHILGMINFRHELKGEELLRFAGHIGYSIRPSERKKGYGKEQLRLCLKEVQKFGLDKVLLTCKSTNEASRRIIMACGGIYESTVYGEESHLYVERYWITP